jgi:prevent-host-death family protein
MVAVGVLEARNNLSALIKRARSGEEVIIMSRDTPQVRLVPVEPAPGHGTGAAILAWLDEHPSANSRMDDDIDAGIAAEREAWD